MNFERGYIMFGYVKPCIPELKVKQHELYRAVYCSLCKSQKKLTGTASSFTLSYDFVFLALMRSIVTEEKLSVINSHCAYLPTRRKKCIASSNAIDYTGYAATLLTYYKLKDNVADSKGIKKLKYKIACLLMKKPKKKAVKNCNLPEEEIANLLEELSTLEKNGETSIDVCADLFGKILSVIASHGIDNELQSFVLDKCFYHIGRWIYIIDAVDDYADDILDGSYNPLKFNELDLSAIDCVLQAILSEVDRYILKIKFYDKDVGDIIKNIVYLGTDSVAKNVFDSTTEKISKMKGKTK